MQTIEQKRQVEHLQHNSYVQRHITRDRIIFLNQSPERPQKRRTDISSAQIAIYHKNNIRIRKIK